MRNHDETNGGFADWWDDKTTKLTNSSPSLHQTLKLKLFGQLKTSEVHLTQLILVY